MEKENKKRAWRARLIALGVALLTFAGATAFTLWQYQRVTAAYLSFDLTATMIVNGVGALILYLIVAHFLKKPHEEEQ